MSINKHWDKILLCLRHGESFHDEGKNTIHYQDFCNLLLSEIDILVQQYGPIKAGEMMKETPLCCRVEKQRLLECYINSGLGYLGVCEICHKSKLGTRYRRMDDVGVFTRMTHLCFGCLVFRSKVITDVTLS